ncbi:MAG: XRE family transcriptional regulator [Lachnospiraceae bacterium]
MENLNQVIAGNLKEIRKKKGLSLEQTANLTAISKSMLSQIERAEVNPTISTVYKLSLGLKVPVTAFTAKKSMPFTKTCKHDLKPLEGDHGRYRLYPVFSFQDGQNFEIFDLEFDQAGEMEGNRQIIGTREFITVYQGQLTISFGTKNYVLGIGDSASYHASDHYVYKNTGSDMVIANIVVQYP